VERRLPELLIGLVALAIAAIVTGFVVADAIRDVKKRRDTITVTGSAREPIRADLATWRISVRAQAADAAAAARQLRRDVARVRSFLGNGGFSGAAVREPPLTTADVMRRAGPRRFVSEYRITQRFDVSTRDVARLERVAGGVSELLAGGVAVSVGSISYVSTRLTEARFRALEGATKNARDRAERLVDGLGGDLGAVRSATVGVFQIVPRNSTEISDYGVNDTTSPEKDVIAVVTVTFAVS
jgi:hypothetical protein